MILLSLPLLWDPMSISSYSNFDGVSAPRWSKQVRRSFSRLEHIRVLGRQHAVISADRHQPSVFRFST